MDPLSTPETQVEELNPYAPPTAEVAPRLQADLDMDRFGPAGTGKRFLNYILDQFGQVAFAMVIAFLFGVLEELGLVSGFIEWSESSNRAEDLAFGYVLAVIYYYFFEVIFSRTPAKWITGTKVVTLSGGKPSALKILGRSLSRLVPFEPFSFLGGNISGWHDRWSGTVVVDLRNPMPARMSPALARHYR